MTFNAQTKTGAIVLESPATMRVFEALNVDCCCGGHRDLEKDLHLCLESHLLFPRAIALEASAAAV
jgi:iron-sulfur cluster repair protein YtfE (RIC family)